MTTARLSISARRALALLKAGNAEAYLRTLKSVRDPIEARGWVEYAGRLPRLTEAGREVLGNGTRESRE